MCGEVRGEKLRGIGEGETMIQYHMQRNVLNKNNKTVSNSVWKTSWSHEWCSLKGQEKVIAKTEEPSNPSPQWSVQESRQEFWNRASQYGAASRCSCEGGEGEVAESFSIWQHASVAVASKVAQQPQCLGVIDPASQSSLIMALSWNRWNRNTDWP